VVADTGKERRAVLVLPDVGLPQERMDALKEEFQNSIVGTLKRASARPDIIIVVVVVVVA
jgi:hypothetical protein